MYLIAFWYNFTIGKKKEKKKEKIGLTVTSMYQHAAKTPKL